MKKVFKNKIRDIAKKIANRICILIIVLSICITNLSSLSVAEAIELLKTDGFELSADLLNIISDPESKNYGVGPVDANADGILTLSEIGAINTLYLDCADYSISDWNGLQYFTKLDQLYLADGDYEKIAFNNIPEANEIESIVFDGCYNWDKLTGLNNFTRLSTVKIFSGEVISCKVFEQNTNIKKLDISAKGVSDLETINTTNITALYLTSGTLKGAETLPAIDKLEELNITNNGLTDLTVIENLKGVKKLDASYNEITNIDVLADFENLVEINLEGNDVNNVEALMDLKKVKTIYLSNASLSEYTKIELLKKNIECKNPIIGNVGEEIDILKDDKVFINEANYYALNFESVDTSVMEVQDKKLKLIAPGYTRLKFNYRDELTFEYDVFIRDEVLTTPEPTKTLLKTEGFTVSDEMLVALSNPETLYSGSGPLDKNTDGVLTLEEIEDVYSLDLDCSGCDITDWSDLKYFKGLQNLWIINGDLSKIKFNNLQENNIWKLGFIKCINNNKVENLNNFAYLSTVEIDTIEDISCKSLSSADKLIELYILAPKVRDIDAITQSDFAKLHLITSSVIDLSGHAYSILESTDTKVAEVKNEQLVLCKEGTSKLKFTFEDGSIIDYAIEISDGNITLPLPTDTPAPTDIPVPALLGDLNDDSVINAEDALLVLKHAARLENLEEEKLIVADLNVDKIIDANDALEILKIAAKIK